MRATDTRTPLLCLCLLWLCGCASLPKDSVRSPRDPWERMNRTTYRFNNALDRTIVRPVASGYVKITPQPVRTGVTNFFDNLETPITMVNDLLQGQLKGFCNDTARLLMNTTLGIGGLFDPATRAGLDKNDRDFGQTLGKWGVKTGPYVVLPIVGPSNVRDVFGRVGDDYANPRHYLNNSWAQFGLWAARGIDKRSQLLPIDSTILNAYDPYAFVRNAYLQHRDFKVSGDKSSDESEQEQKLFDEASQDADAAAAAPEPAAPPPAPQPH